MKAPTTAEEILELGYDFARIIPGPPLRAMALTHLLCGDRWKLSIDLDEFGCRTSYTYLSFEAAVMAMANFDPATMTEPAGWYRCDTDGRRRPDLTAATEEVRP
jgi:hypothetical protein